jgi:hypothetical protein
MGDLQMFPKQTNSTDMGSQVDILSAHRMFNAQCTIPTRFCGGVVVRMGAVMERNCAIAAAKEFSG